MDKVAKVLIFVKGGSEDAVLLSLKRKPQKKSDGKLELLGGRLDADESPLEALIRELSEEEESGALATNARAVQPAPIEVKVAGANHFLFRLRISEADYRSLIASRQESYGFQLIPAKDLFSDALQYNLTRRTRAILDALKISGALSV